MQHDKYELTHKGFLRALRELTKVEDRIRQIPWRKLDEPYQQGWELSIVLRKDFARSSKGPILEGLLQKYGRPGVIRSPKIVSAIRKKPQLDHARRHLFIWNVYYGPYVRSISELEYQKLSPQWKKYYEWAESRYPRDAYRFCLPTTYLEIKVDKRIITHTKDLDPVLEKRKAELKKILEPYWMTRSYNKGIYKWIENRKDRRKSNVEIKKQLAGEMENGEVTLE